VQTDESDNSVASADPAKPSPDPPADSSDAAAVRLAQQAEQIGRLEARLEQTSHELAQNEEHYAEELAREAASAQAATEAWAGELAKLKGAVINLHEAHDKNEAELRASHAQREREQQEKHEQRAREQQGEHAQREREQQEKHEQRQREQQGEHGRREREQQEKHEQCEKDLEEGHEQRHRDLLEAHEQRQQDLVDRDKEIAVLSTQLEARAQELERRSQEHQEAAEALERERTRSFEAILDTRMATVESFAKMASERIAGQIEVLRNLEERSSKQELLTDRLFTIVSPSASPVQAMGSWLRESPVRLMAVTFTGMLLFAFFLVGVVSTANRVLGSDGAAPAGVTPTAMAARGEAGAGAETEAGEPSTAEPEGDEPSGAADPSEGDEAGAGTGEADTLKGEAGVAERPAQLDPEQETQRKALRRKMFDAHRKKRWGEVARLGGQLRDEYGLDSEAQLKLADALRRGKKFEEAVVVYLAFIEQNPDSGKIGDALFKGANLLVKLDRTAEALPLYERVSKLPKSEFKREAKKALKALR